MSFPLLNHSPGKTIKHVTTTGPSSYRAGGFAVTIPGVKKVVAAVCNADGLICYASPGSDGKSVIVKAYTAADTEVADGTDLSSKAFTIIAVAET